MVQLRVWGRQITHRAADFTQGQKLVGTPTFTYFSAFISIAITILVYQCYQDDLSKSGAWGCEMSWMSPSYQRIQWKDDPGHRYRLFLYREQGLDIESQVTGYPVLFIPGNAGSYQQVRSIASAASRQYADGKTMTGQSRMDRKLDFFTIDFNEEFSAFSARTLSEQANFVRHAIERILLEYLHMSPSQQPSQVALLAHSMGGIAARLAVIDPDVAPKVDIILTMSTPHTIPPLTIEHEMESIYTKIAKPSQTLLISLCGGVSDTQVVSDSCALSSTLGSGDNGFAVYTTGIPTVWTGIDHQAMVWCHQLRWLIAESLIQMAQQDKRMQKLSIARGKFLNDQQTFPSTSRTFKNLSVSSTDMTVLLRPNAATQRISVEALHCDEECQTVSFSVQQLPFPTHSEAPFPLPGEGIRPEETLLALDVKLVNGKGLLSVASDSHEIIAFGPRVTSTTEDSTWGLAMTPASHIPTSFLVRFGNLASSSLLVRRLEIQTGDCGGK
uniref:GPI inositol-deacylase n=1 Tax=Kwoniella pini CBS 10737 TaxID=1296096 RepID=A0A1B9HYW7_9TREE|nr:uncharacterized protein I206_05254 [Kwoniella pini CBS 10737]OCF48475.1 hypothetical protein I206_05254 [Kwoniella pini CBS 10737]